MVRRVFASLGLMAIVGALAVADDVSARARVVVPAGSAIPGDVNCDNELTPIDPLELLKGSIGLSANDDCAAANSDFNCDQQANEADVPQILRLLAGMQPEECPSEGGDPTSIGLIDEAFRRGDITEETAALYSVFAAFEDPRLPSQYDADDPPQMEMSVDMELIGSSLDEFSAGVRAQLEPFFIAPMHQGSWWDLRYNAPAAAPAGIDTVPGPTLDGQWGYVDAGTANVRLWYPLNDFAMFSLASSTTAEIDSHIWPQLTALMGRQPLPDGGSFTPGRGGDDRIDIIVSNEAPTFGAVGLAPNWCERTSALIYAKPQAAERLGVPFHIGVAHELMHAIVFGYDLAQQPGGNGGCGDAGYNWWHEASATWTEDFLYPNVNTEHTGLRGEGNVQEFVSDLGKPLEFGGQARYGTTARPYGAYLWAFHVARTYGNDIIRQMWENMESQGSIEAMESALGPHGGFEKVWPEFILNVFNKAPFDEFRQWDGIEHAPRDYEGGGSTFRDKAELVRLNSCIGDSSCVGRDGPFFQGWFGNDHLSASADSYKFDDENVRTATFHNGYAYNVIEDEEPSTGKFFTLEPRPAEEIRGLKVQALIKIAGQPWVLEDWTEYLGRTFCRDRASERIEELIIITTNSVPERDYKIDTPAALQGPRGQVSDIGCWRWEGTVTNRYYGDENFEEKIVLTDAVVEVIPYYQYTGQINFQFRLVQGAIDWDYRWTPGECVYDGSEHGMAVTEFSTLGTFNGVIEGPYHRAAAGSFSAVNDGLVTVNCAGEPPETYEQGVGVGFPYSVEPFRLEDGAVIDGSFNSPPSDGMVGVDFSWHFEAQRE